MLNASQHEGVVQYMKVQFVIMLHVNYNEKLPLHTFLPSPAEVLPLPLPSSVVIVMSIAVAVTATAMMLRLVAVTVAVIVAMVILLAPVLISVNRAVSGVGL